MVNLLGYRERAGFWTEGWPFPYCEARPQVSDGVEGKNSPTQDSHETVMREKAENQEGAISVSNGDFVLLYTQDASDKRPQISDFILTAPQTEDDLHMYIYIHQRWY